MREVLRWKDDKAIAGPRIPNLKHEIIRTKSQTVSEDEIQMPGCLGSSTLIFGFVSDLVFGVYDLEVDVGLGVVLVG